MLNGRIKSRSKNFHFVVCNITTVIVSKKICQRYPNIVDPECLTEKETNLRVKT